MYYTVVCVREFVLKSDCVSRVVCMENRVEQKSHHQRDSVELG